jgi:hypothetical protein
MDACKLRRNFPGVAGCMKKGFATIYIVLILSSLLAAVFVMLELATGFAAASVCRSNCQSVGQSILGQYNRELYKRYGVFALRNYEDELKSEALFYLEGCTVFTKSVIKPVPVSVKIYSDLYPALDTEGLAKQLNKLALTNFARRAPNAAEHAKRSINKSALPSKLLGFGSREIVSFSEDLFSMRPPNLAHDEYILKLCGNCLSPLSNTWLSNEVEYILFGYPSDDANEASVRRSLFAVRFAVNSVKKLEGAALPAEPVALAAFLAAVSIDSEKDVAEIMAGGTVDDIKYEGYLRVLLAFLARKEKLARLMDVIQLNLRNIDGSGFRFENYCYGFDMDVEFKKKVFAPISWGFPFRLTKIEQTHVYR